MLLTRMSDAAALALPDDLLWLDEHAWSPVVSRTDYLLTGALLIQSATRQAGRPITLASPADMAWVSLGTVTTLTQWAHTPLSESGTAGRFTLLMNATSASRSFEVAFRHADTALEAEPVLGFAPREDSAPHRLTLRFLEL